MKTPNNKSEFSKVLLVDMDESVRKTLAAALEVSQFRVTQAGNVDEALKLISREPFDVLLCDLMLPGSGDGFTVVSAMRHANEGSVTVVLTGIPLMDPAMKRAVLLQADEVLVKPMEVPTLVAMIRGGLRRGTGAPVRLDRVATILERESASTIKHWLARVGHETKVMDVRLSDEQRTGHLPELFKELVERLRVPRRLGTKADSPAAVRHGAIRREQGYSIPMLVEESRVLQVSIFETLQGNLGSVDFSLLLLDVMTIADEVDSQLGQTIHSFMQTEEPAESLS